MRRLLLLVTVLTATLGLLAPPATATGAFPDTIELPRGSFPEGVTVGAGHTAYVGSLLDGRITRIDLRTGETEPLVAGAPDRLTVGLDFDERSGLVWAVGVDAGAGSLFAFDGHTGEEVAVVPVAGAFLNDLVVTRTAVYITDSFADVLWSVPLDNRGHPAGPAVATPLTGDFTFVTTGQFPINLNGIVASRDGRTLVAAHSSNAVLYRIDPATGDSVEVDLGGAALPNADGLVMVGHRIYVVQNFSNQVTEIALDPDRTSGRVVDVITDPDFQVPATADVFGDHLYVVNARFDVALPPALGGDPAANLRYHLVQVRR